MHGTQSGKVFEKMVAEKLKKMGFKELEHSAWPDCKDKHPRCFTAQILSGCGLYGQVRKVDFRVKIGDRGEFDVEAKFHNGNGTTDQLAWVELDVADQNDFPFFLVVGGSALTDKKHLPKLRKKAGSLNCVLGVGTLEEFAAKLQQEEFAVVLKKVSDRLDRMTRKVFIGHDGKSQAWRTVKDHLEANKFIVEEFERAGVAGKQVKGRLEEIMESADWAVLIITARDTENGTVNANVIHEIGYAQGHLGWEKAIILLQGGCELPSNLSETVWLRFKDEDVKSVFADLMKALRGEEHH